MPASSHSSPPDQTGSSPHQHSAGSPHPRRGTPQQVGQALKRAVNPEPRLHPGLIPGLSVEDTDRKFPTNKTVFVVALTVAVAVVLWAAVAPESISVVGADMQQWITTHFAWLLGGLMIAVLLFMLIVGYGPTGNIKLGADDSRPDYSTGSWIAMLFAAGLGIGLVFYGPLEPLTHLLAPTPATDAKAGTMAAVLPSMSTTILHQASLAWAIYAFVGGAIAYSSYRRGRLPLISSIFEPVFPDGTHKILGGIIDIFAVLVTLFGTAISLGIGALQIRTGTSLLTGKEIHGNAFLIGAMVLLTVVFIFSAVSGIKRGIRMLSNANMIIVVALAAFALITGPTLFILDLFPTSIYALFQNFMAMMSISPSQGDAEKEFLTSWTTMYWAWWVSWSPFVGMFIAKISKGRTLRQFTTVVIFVPALISTVWYTIYGGTAMWMNMKGPGLEVKGSGENVMFDLLDNLPLTPITSTVVLIAVVIFFTTAADSATNVVGSMSQSGRALPSTPITIMWGVTLGLIAIFLLLAGGQDALSGLQSIMVTSAFPFVFIVIGIMIAWAKDLRQDPYMIRRTYAREAISRGVHRGIDMYGDDFVFGTSRVPSEQGAGAEFRSDDPSLTDWYVDHRGARTDEEKE